MLRRLHNFLDQAILNEKADLGNIQTFNPNDETLRIVAQRGFHTEFLEHFGVVRPFDTSACGRAIALASPIIVGDIEQDIAYYPHLKVARTAGYRSVMSQPLYSPDKKLLGVLSLHCRDVRWNWDFSANKEIFGELCKLLMVQPV